MRKVQFMHPKLDKSVVMIKEVLKVDEFHLETVYFWCELWNR